LRKSAHSRGEPKLTTTVRIYKVKARSVEQAINLAKSRYGNALKKKGEFKSVTYTLREWPEFQITAVFHF
jgi:hypothetical protein